jgi:serine protease DegQ
MKWIRGAAFVILAFVILLVATYPAVIARASVPLPLVEQAAGTASLAPLLKKVTPAVVSISVKVGRASEAGSQQKKEGPREVRRAETAPDRQGGVRAAGSGVVIDAREGLIVTNNHVIVHADEIAVTLVDHRELPAKLLGGDPDTDIAVLKVAADNLTAIPMGDSNEVEVGDFVFAVGNPLQGQTVTSGIVSGLHRNNLGIEAYENFIQTDAAIYPGDSGGALVDLRGDLIGINTAFVGNGNTNPGMGFAIPIDMVRIVVDRIVETGNVRRGKLGIAFEDPTPALIRDYRLALSAAATTPVITKVEAGSAANRAGLKPGDVVTGLFGKPVRNANDLRLRLGLLWVGDAAEVTVMRKGQPQVFRLAVADGEQHAKAK